MSTLDIVLLAAAIYVALVLAWIAFCLWFAPETNHERAPRGHR